MAGEIDTAYAHIAISLHKHIVYGYQHRCKHTPNVNNNTSNSGNGNGADV